MKRMHLSLSVNDLQESIAFYTAVFGAAPTMVRSDYAKWMLDDPHVNFVIENRGDAIGFTHMGIQAETAEELAEINQRFATAGVPKTPLGEETCCYARMSKSWVRDPQGVPIEAFHTTDLAEEYGEGTLHLLDQSEPQQGETASRCC